MAVNEEKIQLRIHGTPDLPTLIYLPGLHGDWTLVSSFREAVKDKLRFIEFTYPRHASWRLDDYATAVIDALCARGITAGWILAESFSSQVAWKILEDEKAVSGFSATGLILAGGFVRHPAIPGVHCFHAAHRMMPWWCFRLLLKVYASYARFRHRRAPETLASLGEFIERRTRTDRAAIASRYPLIAQHDLRPVASGVQIPVYALSGGFDPIVPWPLVLPWLRRNCPGYRGARVIFNADHNVLGTAPQAAAAQVLSWMSAAQRPDSTALVS